MYLEFLIDNFIEKSCGRTQKKEGEQKRVEVGLSMLFSIKMTFIYFYLLFIY